MNMYSTDGKLVAGYVAVEKTFHEREDGTRTCTMSIVAGTFSEDAECVIESFYNKTAKKISPEERELFHRHYSIRAAKLRFSAEDGQETRGRKRISP